jgi:hypothetical protein
MNELEIDEILNNEDWDRATIIEFMMSQCWEADPDGGVRHANDHSRHYDSWLEALKDVIAIGSVQ